MKKLMTLAVVATLLLAGSAIAAPKVGLIKPNATFVFGVGGAASGPTTTNNDDSCDIGVTPAATLLLPYFSVETATRAETTFFTVTNVTDLPQIARSLAPRQVVTGDAWDVAALSRAGGLG